MRTDLAALLVLATTATLPVPPAAAQTGPYYLALGQSFNHESNIYRLADGAVPPGSGSRADSVAITSLLAGFDQTISRQRLRADASLRASRFRRNDTLDNEGHGLRLAWDGETVGGFSGSASASLDRSLVRFDATAEGGVVRNIATSRQLDTGLRWGLVTRWSAELAVSHAAVDYSASTFDAREYRQNSLSSGLRYAPGGAWSASLGLRTLRGRYPRFGVDTNGNFVADRYRGRYVDLGLRWSGGAHRLDGRVSLGDTSFERASATDFAGLTGVLTWGWQPTGKLRLETRLARDRGQESSAIGYFITTAGTLTTGRYADFSRISTSLGTSLTWGLTAKLSLSGSALFVDRDLRSSGLAGVPTAGGDSGRQFTLGARWQATRTVVLGCDIGSERRTTDNTQLSTNLSNRTRSCFGQIGMP